jgi:hypothetical protein
MNTGLVKIMLTLKLICPISIQSSQTLRRYDKSLNGLVDLVLQSAGEK